MGITITVTGDTPLEALASLTAFGMNCMSNRDVYAAANRILEAERHKEAQRAAEQSATVPNSDTTPAAAPDPAANASPVTDLPQEPYVEEPPFTQGTWAPGGSDQPEEAAPAPAPDPPKTGKAPKLEDVRAAGLEAARKYGQPAVKAILEQFGVSNMTSLAESDRVAFLEALKGLGDGNA